MAYPRSQLVSGDEPGFYHCVCRCVRRAFLCGRDDASGKDHEHRRQWIEDRIFKPAESFAVSVYAYAVMSNHFHVVLRSDPRMANREDGCTGRFWEGRFKCQALLDEQADLSCMAYVDLNPVRAGMCGTLRDSEHTSVRYRLDSARSAIGRALRAGSEVQSLKPVAGLDAAALSELTKSSCIDLVRRTGLQAHPDKRGKLSASSETPPEGLWSVANHPREWIRRVQGTESRYYRAIGSAEALMLKAADLGQRWMKGVSGEYALRKLREQPIPW